MLAKRIIPTILMKNGLLVKGKQFSADRVVGNALQAARIHAARGVDELMMLDVTATKEEREPNYRLVEQLTKYTQIPVTVGGGVSSAGAAYDLFMAGADKVCVGSRWQAIEYIAQRFGSQAVVASLDVKKKTTTRCAAQFARDLVEMGAGEILLQDIVMEGTMGGFDLDLITTVTEAVPVPVIASGGCGSYKDIWYAFGAGADAVAVGALFQFTDSTPRKAAQYLDSLGMEVRLD